MSVIKSNLLLLLAAAIWGFAFVAQRVGMEHVGPFLFNGVRFFLGSMSLLPLIWYFRKDPHVTRAGVKKELLAGLLAGTILFMGASLQQIGLKYTTAGKAAFITALYIVLVPILGRFLGDTVRKETWFGCILAVGGLYFLSIKGTISIQMGDLLQLIGALFWACHILVIGHFSRRVDVLKLSCFQFLTCSALSLIVAAFTETAVVSDLVAAAVPLLYGGFCSVGIAYTLQVVAQKHAQPAHAAIILSMETVFAAIGGYLILGERLGGQEFVGCIMIFAGMMVSQLGSLNKPTDIPIEEVM